MDRFELWSDLAIKWRANQKIALTMRSTNPIASFWTRGIYFKWRANQKIALTMRSTNPIAPYCFSKYLSSEQSSYVKVIRCLYRHDQAIKQLSTEGEPLIIMQSRPSTASSSSSSMRRIVSPRGAQPKVTLERVLGLTTLSNSTFAVHPVTGEIAYAAGCVVVLYNTRRSRQTRFFRAAKAISCITFSPDGQYIAVGERGHAPSVNVWNLTSGNLVSELKKHKYGISCIAFSPDSQVLISVGFHHDRFLYAWKFHDVDSLTKPGYTLMGCSRMAQKILAIDFAFDGAFFVTVGMKHVKFWYMDPVTGLLVVNAGAMIDNIPTIESRLAIMPAQKDSTFISVNCGKDAMKDMVYWYVSRWGRSRS